MEYKLIGNTLFKQVAEQAETNPRRRMNYNFHESLSDPIHRLLNVMMEDTYLPPHRHTNPIKDEIFLVLQGSVLALLFDDKGQVTFSKVIDPKKGVHGMDFSGGIWHTFIVLEPETVVYEVKAGPYVPLAPQDIAPWAPSVEDKSKAEAYKQQLKETYCK